MNFMRTTLLLGVLTGLFLLVGYAIGGRGGMVIAFGVAVAMNFGAYWYSDSMVLSMYNAHQVGPDQSPEFYRLVQELAGRAGLPMPRVYIIDDPSPNAFATGRDPQHAAVAATSGLLRMLNRQELAGVMAHELAHVQNRDILVSTIAATLGGAITLLAQFGGFFGGGQRDGEGNGGGGFLGGLLMMILAPLAATLIQMGVSRSREYLADEAGGRICGHPLWLASALAKLELGSQQIPMESAERHPATAHMFIVNPLSGASLSHLFSTHPPMGERIQRLQQQAGPGATPAARPAGPWG
ncbi:MAG: zinc metalloprotease HtpX [Magnetococcales bacterium]|nr:zinc metalloprotease HtpX [Magnetococcales bacterium]